MAITTRDQLVASIKQPNIKITKTASRTSVANIPFSVFDLAGNPGAGTLAGANTANGVVPTDAVAGYPVINAFSGANKGYIARMKIKNTVSGWVDIFDRLFIAGAYAFNANTALASQPSFAARVPNGSYVGLELWIETVTAFTGNLSIAVTYTNQDGVTGRTTGTIATGVAPTVGRCIQLPLQSGDSGIQKIESVVATVATVGTFNVMILRRIISERIPIANGGRNLNFIDLNFPEIFTDSALYAIVSADSTATGNPEIDFDINNG